MTDDFESLIRRFRDGDEEAFQELFEAQEDLLRARINPRMATALKRKVSVQDVLQETRIAAFENRSRFDGRTSTDFRRWILGIVERKIRQVLGSYLGTGKREVGREGSRAQREDTAQAVGAEPSPSEEAISGELARLAKQALEMLSAEQREVIRLFREEGLPLAEVAKRLGRSYEATKKLRQRALFEYTETFKRLRGEEHD